MTPAALSGKSQRGGITPRYKRALLWFAAVIGVLLLSLGALALVASSQPGADQHADIEAAVILQAVGALAFAPSFVAVVQRSKAAASLVLGLVSILCCGIITGPIAFFLGQSALGSIRQGGGTVGGKGMARAGCALGAVGFLLWVFILHLALTAATYPPVCFVPTTTAVPPC